MQRIPMTPEGHHWIAQELKRHKEILRPQIVRDIEEARAHGDISENAEFEDAKHRQALCEGKIRELEAKIAAAEVIDVRRLPPSDRVIFGTTVDLYDEDTEEKFTYRIVGEDEADVKSGLISVTSPIARAMVGHHVEDEVTVTTPGGSRRLSITAVHYK